MDRNKSSQLEQRVGQTVARLQAQHQAGVSTARATLAALRQSAAMPFGSVCELWELEDGCLPDSVRSNRFFAETLEADACEKAAHVALCTYAFHQQGNTSGMHTRHDGMKGTFGNAVRQAACRQRSDGKMPAEFRLMIASQDFGELTDHLRRVAHLMSSHGVPCDYGELAKDLFFWQVPTQRNGVIRLWGRQWSSMRQDSDSADSESNIA